ncbi:MAG: hypothetical protein AABX29_01450, partial [Nanoarchaeota archaeon]
EKSYEINANAYLLWKTIEWSKEKGIELYDLGGIDENAKENSAPARVNKFKLSFGDRIDFYEYTDSILYAKLRPLYGRFRNSWLGKFIRK